MPTSLHEPVPRHRALVAGRRLRARGRSTVVASRCFNTTFEHYVSHTKDVPLCHFVDYSKFASHTKDAPHQGRAP